MPHKVRHGPNCANNSASRIEFTCGASRMHAAGCPFHPAKFGLPGGGGDLLLGLPAVGVRWAVGALQVDTACAEALGVSRRCRSRFGACECICCGSVRCTPGCLNIRSVWVDDAAGEAEWFNVPGGELPAEGSGNRVWGCLVPEDGAGLLSAPRCEVRLSRAAAAMLQAVVVDALSALVSAGEIGRAHV